MYYQKWPICILNTTLSRMQLKAIARTNYRTEDKRPSQKSAERGESWSFMGRRGTFPLVDIMSSIFIFFRR